MAEKSVKHPQTDQLVAFGLGKLDPTEATKIAEHLDHCRSCSETIVNLQDDTFVGLVRKSPMTSPPCPFSDLSRGVPGERRSPEVTVGVEPGATGAANETTGLPPELREHPRYEILERIGRGGMGDVYKAQHKLMNRLVALKVIKPELVQNEAAVQRFHREVQAAARLHHPNIVSSYDAEQTGNVHYLVMEFVDGVNLDEVVRQRGKLPVAEACEYIRQVAEGLQGAHGMGMVHRDIKPHNLMVRREAKDESREPEDVLDASGSRLSTVGSRSSVKILDFGLASFASEAAADFVEKADPDHRAPAAEMLKQLTLMGTMMGTPDYIAPEQAKDAHSADIRADIYSLGCTFYTLLAGQAPFSDGSVLDKVQAHTQKEPPPLSEFRDDVPEEAQAILRKMMAKDPAERYQTPQNVVDALRIFIDQRIDDRLRDCESGRPPRKPWGATTGESDDDIRRWYGKVADVMLSVGLINIVTSLIFVGIIVWLASIREDYRSFATHWVTLVCIASLVPGVVLLTLVGRVRRMQTYGSLLFAVLLCMLPTPGAFLGIPVGLVTVFHLLSTECRQPLGVRPRPSFGEGAIFFGLLICPLTLTAAGMVAHYQWQLTAVTFEIEDPQFEVEFQGQTITAANDGRRIQIVPDDKQQFHVARKDGGQGQLVTFTLPQGRRVTLRVVNDVGNPSVIVRGGDLALHQQPIYEPELPISLPHPELFARLNALADLVADGFDKEELDQWIASESPLLVVHPEPLPQLALEWLGHLSRPEWQQLLRDGHLQWQPAQLELVRRETAARMLQLLFFGRQGLLPDSAELSDAAPAMAVENVMKHSDVGFAIVEIPDSNDAFISWYVVPRTSNLLPAAIPLVGATSDLLERHGENVVPIQMKHIEALRRPGAKALADRAQLGIAVPSSGEPAVDELLKDAHAVYTFEEETFYREQGRTRVRDVSGNEHDASVEDEKMAYSPDGQAGDALACNRKALTLPGFALPAAKLRLPKAVLSGLDEYTLAMWVRDSGKPTMPSGKSVRTLFQEGFPKGTDAVFPLSVNFAEQQLRAFHLGELLEEPPGTPLPLMEAHTPEGTIPKDQWFFLALTLLKKEAAGVLRITIDEKTYHQPFASIPTKPQDGFALVGGIDGLIDELAVFSRGLTEVEIDRLREHGRAGKPLVRASKREK